MEKLADVLKIFLEKHLMPSVIALAGAIITLLWLHDSHWMVVKLGDTLFLILAFCVYFTAIQFVVKAWQKINAFIENKEYAMEERIKTNQEITQKINEFVDRLSPHDKNILLTFVENGNKVLVANEKIALGYQLLEDTDKINRTEFMGDSSDLDETKYWTNQSPGGIYGSNLYQYKLKDPLFQGLKQIYDKTGKLGNF